MTNSMSDEELMSQVRNGVGEMLGVLFERYQVPLFNFYLKLTGERAASEDLVQEVFFRILKYRQSYRPETGWEPEMSPAIAPVDTAQQSQENALLYRALMQLPLEKREVLVLSRFQELKYEEIAQLLDCELGTVKTRVHRALQELRDIFHELQSGKPWRGSSSEGAGTWPGSGSLQ